MVLPLTSGNLATREGGRVTVTGRLRRGFPVFFISGLQSHRGEDEARRFCCWGWFFWERGAGSQKLAPALACGWVSVYRWLQPWCLLSGIAVRAAFGVQPPDVARLSS